MEFSPIGGFSIRSAYDSPISLVRVPESRSKLRFRGMVRVWKICALSKIIMFSKHLLQNRLSTRKNVSRRRIVSTSSDVSRAMCV